MASKFANSTMITVIVQAEPEFVDLLRKNVNSFYLDDHLPLSADPGDEEFFVHQQLRYECGYLTVDPATPCITKLCCTIRCVPSQSTLV